MAPILVLGGYGVFGRQVAEQFVARGRSVVIAGRQLAKAEAVAGQLGSLARPAHVDISHHEWLLGALTAGQIVIHAAGPFSQNAQHVVDCCLEAGCHYIDLADDRGYVRALRARQADFTARNLTAVVGASSLPGVSGAAASVLLEGGLQAVERITVALLIGAKNPKGAAAVQSLTRLLGATIQAPQGVLRGLGDAEVLSFPRPFGARAVLNFDSPEYDLFPDAFGVPCVEVKVGFQSRLMTHAIHAFARWAPQLGRRVLPWVAEHVNRFLPFGGRGGAIWCQTQGVNGAVQHLVVLRRDQGQLLAVLPAVYAAERLSESDPAAAGVLTAYELLGPRYLLQRLKADGCELFRHP